MTEVFDIKGLFALKLMSLISFVLGIYYCGVTGQWFLLALSYLYYRLLTLLSNGIGLHRYFSHKSFVTTKNKHIFLCVVSVLIGEASPTLSSLIHRHHHRYSDSEKDVHSPRHGFVHTIVTWILKPKQWFVDRQLRLSSVIDHAKDPYIKFISANYNKIWISLIIITLLIDFKLCLFFVLMPVAWEILINSFFSRWFVHIKLPGSYRNYDTKDNSWNNKILLLLNSAEVYHNNHHNNPSKFNQGDKPGEYDPTAWVIDKFFVENKEERQYKW